LSAKVKSIFKIEEKKQAGKFDWLVGSWENTHTQNTYEDWELDQQNELLGYGYKLVKGEKVISEYIRIFSSNGNYYYESKLPNNEEPIVFKIINLDECGFVCENSDYDFPKKIIYILDGYDSLNTQLSSNKRKINFTFKKVN